MHEELIAAIGEWNPALQGTIDRQTSLIGSGLLDSLVLMRLLMWIEEKLGRPIPVSAIDMSRDWATVDAIVRFVDRERDRR